MERLLAIYRATSSPLAIALLVAVNLIPLVGAVFWGWNVYTLLILYWIENGIVGVFNVLKMALAQGPVDTRAGAPEMVKTASRFTLIPFFILHYGIFWLVHGVFVLTLPQMAGIAGSVDMARGVNPLTILVAVVALSISHAVSYRLNFIGREEYRRVSAAAQMFKPYGRLLILHITIVFGALAIGLTGAPAAAVAVLVGLKTALDLVLFLADHGRAGGSGVRSATG